MLGEDPQAARARAFHLSVQARHGARCAAGTSDAGAVRRVIRLTGCQPVHPWRAKVAITEEEVVSRQGLEPRTRRLRVCV